MPSGFLLEKRGSSALAITSSWKCACIAPHPHSWYPLGSSLHDHVTGNVDMEAFWSCPLEVSLYMVERGICSELCSWKMAGVCSFTLNRGSHCRFWGAQEFVQGYCRKSFQLSAKPRCVYDTRGFGCGALWRACSDISPKTAKEAILALLHPRHFLYFWYRFSKFLGHRSKSIWWHLYEKIIIPGRVTRRIRACTLPI